MANSVGPDQTATKSGSALFAQTYLYHNHYLNFYGNLIIAVPHPYYCFGILYLFHYKIFFLPIYSNLLRTGKIFGRVLQNENSSYRRALDLGIVLEGKTPSDGKLHNLGSF